MSDLPLPDPTTAIAPPELLEPLAIQHDTDPADDRSRSRRTPHLGHALLFLTLCALGEFSAQFIAILLSGKDPGPEHHPLLSTIAIIAGYLVTLAIAVPLFPLLWHRSFLDGLHWTGRAARLHWKQLVLVGFLLTLAAQSAEHLFTSPAKSDLVELFATQASAWLLAIAGVSLVPMIEEMAFRGFLLPAFAIAYDWLSLKRTPAAITLWQQTTDLSRPALLFGALLSSLAFAALHGPQIHWSRGAICILFAVSLVLSAVRLRTRSVACSTLVHATYNGTIFLAVALSTHGYRHVDITRVPH